MIIHKIFNDGFVKDEEFIYGFRNSDIIEKDKKPVIKVRPCFYSNMQEDLKGETIEWKKYLQNPNIMFYNRDVYINFFEDRIEKGYIGDSELAEKFYTGEEMKVLKQRIKYLSKQLNDIIEEFKIK